MKRIKYEIPMWKICVFSESDVIRTSGESENLDGLRGEYTDGGLGNDWQ